MGSILNFFQSFFSSSAPQNNFSGIVVAKVIEIQKHPNADRLRLVKLDSGEKIIEPVVCGAFNFGAGDSVVLALPGAKIARGIHTENHEPFTLAKAKIRGIESQGMICAAFELGLGPLSEKPEIIVLKNSPKPGSQFTAAMLK